MRKIIEFLTRPFNKYYLATFMFTDKHAKASKLEYRHELICAYSLKQASEICTNIIHTANGKNRDIYKSFIVGEPKNKLI